MVYTLRFFSLQNAVCFIILTFLASVLFTFYIQDVLKFKKLFRRQKVKCIHQRTSPVFSWGRTDGHSPKRRFPKCIVLLNVFCIKPI